ncbi:MAG: hypothetical protein J6R32_06300 [Bacteroidales bacterium]|nr:hypothetical protein [Bacteroidales bacterium]
MDLLEPKLIHLEKSGDFYISRLPCMVAREVFLRYAASNINVIELARNYAPSSGDIATKMLSYTAHLVDGREIRMESDTLLNQHVLSFADLGKLEGEMILYNFSFLDVARWSPYLARYKIKLESLTTKILTNLLQYSLKEKQRHSTN